MRTTLSLDDDVAALLRRALKKRGQTLKGVVNEALRRGLLALDESPTRRRYRITAVSLGRPTLPNLDNIGEVLAHAEGDAYR